ncbi:MAG: thioredoxin domain-containing protein [Myxococcales bacterium]|nr:thioredoxin domain-containing protein [Myxococcales bacterium]
MRRAATTVVLVLLGCSGQPTVKTAPVDLSDLSAIESEDPPTASGEQRVDWAGIPPNRRRDVLDVLEATYCPACLCAESAATCLTAGSPCGCRDCAEIMARFVTESFRQGLSKDEVLDLSAKAWIQSFEQAPIAFDAQEQPSRGSGSIDVVEFADFTCAHCARTAPVLEELVDRRSDVRLVYFFHPRPTYEASILSSEAAEEARVQGRFWTFAKELYAMAGRLSREEIVLAATNVGLDRTALTRALDDHRHRDTVMADKAVARSAAVEGTPALFVGGRPFVLPRTLANLEIWVDMEALRRQCVGAGAN